MQKKLATQSRAVPEDLEHLLALTNAGIADLRHYMGELRENGARDSGLLPGGLLPAVQRFTKKFAEATGIVVHVEAKTASLSMIVWRPRCSRWWLKGSVTCAVTLVARRRQ